MKKKLLLLLALILCFSMIFVLASCGEDDKTTNNSPNSSIDGGSNNGGSNGGSNSGGSNNGGNDNEGNNGGNNGGSNSGTSSLGTPVSIPDLDYSFNINIENVNSVAFKVTDAKLTLDNTVVGEGNDYFTKDEYTVYSVTVGEGYIGLDDNGKLVGYGKGVLNSKGVHTGVDQNFNCGFYIENNDVYFDFGGGVTGEYTEKVPYQAFKVSVDDITELVEMESDLSEMEGQMEQIEALLPEVEAWVTDVLIPILENVNLDGADELSENIINKLIAAYKNDDGSYTFAYNYNFIKEIAEASEKESISELIDLIIDDGFFDEIEDLIADEAIYELTVVDVINYLESERGIDFKATIDAVDALAAIYTGDSSMTLVKLLNAYADTDFPDDFDFYDFALNNEYSNMTVMDAIMQMIGEGASENEVKTQIAGYVALCKSKTIFDFIMPETDSEPYEYNEKAPTPSEIIDYMISYIDNIMALPPYSITFSSTGEFEYLTINSSMAEALYAKGGIGPEFERIANAQIVIDKNLNVTITAESDKIDVSGKVEFIPGESVSPNTAYASQIKSKLEGIHILTHEEILNILGADNDYVYYDSYEGCYYAFDSMYYSSYDYNVYCYVTKIYPGAVGVAIIDCCNASIYQNLYAGETDQAKYYVGYYETSTEALANVTYSDMLSYAEFGGIFIDSIDFLYENDVASNVPYNAYYNYMHDYERTSSETTDLTCGDIYYNEYRCINCGETYRSYNTVEHNYGVYYTTSAANGSTSATFTSAYGCVICGNKPNYETDSYNGYTVTVNSELPFNKFNANGVAFSVTITEETAGEYVFYSDNYYTSPDGYVYELLSDGTLSDYISYDYSGFDITVNLEAGKTYVFQSSYASNTYSVTLEKYSYCNENGCLYVGEYEYVDGSFVSAYYCQYCGTKHPTNTESYTVTVDSVLDFEPYDFPNSSYLAFKVTIDAEMDMGDYSFISSGAWPDGCIYELLSDGTLNTVNHEHSGFNFSATLVVGNTYVFTSTFEAQNYTLELKRYSYCDAYGHSYVGRYKLADESQGVNGGFTGGRYCEYCDYEEEPSYNVTITTDLDCQIYEYENGYLAFSVTIDEETAGYYSFTSNGYSVNGVDTYGKIYVIDEWGDLSFVTDNDDYDEWDFACFATLEAGKTYVFVSDFEYSDYNLFLSPAI